MTSKAFTLVELLIVVGIIGLLATIGVAAYSSAKANSRNMQRKANLTQTAKALELYATDHGGQYPTTGGGWRGDCTSFGSYPDTGAGAWIPGFSPAYMSALPHDPNTNVKTSTAAGCPTAASSCYLYRSDGTDFKLLAHCTPEGTWTSADPFYDPIRIAHAWQISTPGGAGW